MPNVVTTVLNRLFGKEELTEETSHTPLLSDEEYRRISKYARQQEAELSGIGRDGNIVYFQIMFPIGNTSDFEYDVDIDTIMQVR